MLEGGRESVLAKNKKTKTDDKFQEHGSCTFILVSLACRLELSTSSRNKIKREKAEEENTEKLFGVLCLRLLNLNEIIEVR